MRITTVSKKNPGMTLTEIMLAMALLASAFIPIIGVMGTSMKATDKDDRTIRAVNICQEKMNRALQFPFGVLEPVAPLTSVTYGGALASTTLKSDATANAISLHLGQEDVNGVEIISELKIDDQPGNFLVPTFNDVAKLEDDKIASATGVSNPSSWGWEEKSLPYAGLYYKYTLTVRWKDKGSEVEKFYTLASNKAKVRK